MIICVCMGICVCVKRQSEERGGQSWRRDWDEKSISKMKLAMALGIELRMLAWWNRLLSSVRRGRL